MTTYNVGLNDGVDYDAFWNEIETDGSGSTWVPNRAVDIVNERPSSLRQCWYELTDDEAEKLRNDPRVYCVEIPPEHRTDIEIGFSSYETGLYTKIPGDPYQNEINWGLFRINSTTNSTAADSGTLTYSYPLDGTGVDIVIQDSGCQIDHPDFQDAHGTSRIQQIDWYTSSGVSGTMPSFAEFYADTDGHGTHVTGVSAGKTYGRAKNSQIYIMTVSGLNGPGTTGISVTDTFDCIKGWHNNKPVDPTTGYKRPTVVNMSWGYTSTFTNINGGSYRGTPWTGTTKQPSYGMIGSAANRFGVRVASVDLDVQELYNAGVVICGAAGNYSQTIDVFGGADYDNYFNQTGYGARYYMRGSSPACAPEVICVGAVSTTEYLGQETKTYFSESGPRVDLYSPGEYIVSTISDVYGVNYTEVSPYYWNNNYNIAAVSGTSQATPNVTGVVAQLLQMYPNTTPAAIKTKLITMTTSNVLYSTGLTTDYSDDKSLHGSENRYAYQSFNSGINITLSGEVSINNTSLGT